MLQVRNILFITKKLFTEIKRFIKNKKLLHITS